MTGPRIDDDTHYDLVSTVLGALTDDLRRRPWKGHPNPVAGHCYVVSEVLLYVIGATNWKSMRVRHEGATHWFIQHREDGRIIDATAGQFQGDVPYDAARGAGFLTKRPSKRAYELLERIEDQI